jgi:HK97 family phage portal protein
MNLAARLLPRAPERAGLVELFPTWATQAAEAAPQNFRGMVEQVYKVNPIIFAAIQARMMLFSDVRFGVRRMSTGDVDTEHPALEHLRHPWPGGTTSEMLARMEQDGSLSGNAYIFRGQQSPHLQRLQPDKVQVMSNGRQVMGYLYSPDGINNGPTVALMPDEVAHYTPIPDPSQNFVGMSWVQTVLLDGMTDQTMAKHQAKFYENAATPNLFVKVEQQLTDESRTKLREELERRYGGWQNAYKTIVLDGGADIRAVGQDFQQSDFVSNRAANEGRIVLASGVPPIILGIQAGLDASTFSNYEQAMKQFSILLRKLWRDAATALASITPVPRGTVLYPDESEVQALQDNNTNIAALRQAHAETISSLIMAGFKPEAAVKAVMSGDYEKFLDHTGMVSVQMHTPGENSTAPAPSQEIDDEAGNITED